MNSWNGYPEGPRAGGFYWLEDLSGNMTIGQWHNETETWRLFGASIEHKPVDVAMKFRYAAKVATPKELWEMSWQNWMC